MLIFPKVQIYFYETALGQIGIAEQQDRITGVYFATDRLPAQLEINETTLIKAAFSELDAYLNGNLKNFSVPFAPEGSAFMQTVWKAVCAVPYGHTASYKDIAHTIGNPKAVRAVGLANRKNPIPIFIPCHRIIGSNGKLVGYSGGLSIKQQLLSLESQYS